MQIPNVWYVNSIMCVRENKTHMYTERKHILIDVNRELLNK